MKAMYPMMQQIQRDLLKGWDVLLVDDDPASLDIARMLLKHYGATVHTAVNGEQGLETLTTIEARLILSDLSMPVMDGWDMITHIRANPRTAQIPIVALTAHAMIGDQQRALEVGSSAYMSKPINPSTFMLDLVNSLEGVVDFS